MKVHEIICEGMNHDNATKIVDRFIKFAAKELGLKTLPKIHLHSGHERSVKHHSFGGYGNQEINVTMSGRHIMDLLRTLAHEMVHFRQDLNNQLNNASGKDGSPEENEANAEAAIVMRKWGKKYPQLFSKPSID